MAPKWDPEAYVKYRPRYPDTLFDLILEYGGPEMATDLAVDCGCGSGQVIADLADRFTQVIGIDPSTEQLNGAYSAPNVEYRIGPAENTGLPDNCANLVTAAAALHWFDQAEFFKEAKRLLKPGGVVAAWSYNVLPMFPGNNQAASDAYKRLRDILWTYMDPRLQVAMSDGYVVHLPVAQMSFASVELKHVVMHWYVSIEIMTGWMRSWSPFTAFKEDKGETEAEAQVELYAKELREALGVTNDTQSFVVTFPLDLLLATND